MAPACHPALRLTINSAKRSQTQRQAIERTKPTAPVDIGW
jgi:hypothetical protein